MFDAVSEAQRDAITVVVFIGTFFIAVGIGRFLKGRAGVRHGLLFRLFSLILAFYAAIAIYGVHAPWRNYLAAAPTSFGTAVFVSLIHYQSWHIDLYMNRQTNTSPSLH